MSGFLSNTRSSAKEAGYGKMDDYDRCVFECVRDKREWVFLCVCVCVCVCVYMCVHMHMSVYIWVYKMMGDGLRLHVCLYVCTLMCVYVSVYEYVCWRL